MAESNPPAASFDVPGRRARRRKARKSRTGKSAAGTVTALARQTKGRANDPATSPQAAVAPSRNEPSRSRDSRGKVQTGTEAGWDETDWSETGKRTAPTPAPVKSRETREANGTRRSYAAIDLGTNNCRLLIARPSGENFTVIDAFSRVVRLGEGLAQSGRLSDAAMERTLSALRICAEKLMRRNVFLARSVATEACRRAENGAQFIDRVRRETGIALDIISAREEARLAVLGCHVLLEEGIGPAMIFDIGGGSTELVLIESTDTVPRILDWQSVPWGVVSLSESCMGETATREQRLAHYSRMRELVRESFSAFAQRLIPVQEQAASFGPLRLLGTSGTVTTLASLHLELPQYDRRKVDGLIVPSESMRSLSAQLSAMNISERRELACIGHERADLVVAGCAILESILDIWPAHRLGVADRGIREGILRSLITSHTTTQDKMAPTHEHAPRAAGGGQA